MLRKKETYVLSIRWSPSLDKYCPECGFYAKETATGNMVDFKYRCKNGHTWGVNDLVNR